MTENKYMKLAPILNCSKPKDADINIPARKDNMRQTIQEVQIVEAWRFFFTSKNPY